jgi:hypothetical protein
MFKVKSKSLIYNFYPYQTYPFKIPKDMIILEMKSML